MGNDFLNLLLKNFLYINLNKFTEFFLKFKQLETFCKQIVLFYFLIVLLILKPLETRVCLDVFQWGSTFFRSIIE